MKKLFEIEYSLKYGYKVTGTVEGESLSEVIDRFNNNDGIELLFSKDGCYYSFDSNDVVLVKITELQ